jgi:DegV family protein with EDD domain
MLRIVTDSTANLPEAVVREHGLSVVPLRLVCADSTYRDGVDITPAQFYRLLASARALPTTSQPPAAEFELAYERILEAGDDALTVTISGKLSGTHDSAAMALRRFSAERVAAFDSGTTAAPLAFMVLVAAAMAESGATAAQVLQALEVMRQKTQVLFVVDTLEYLQKGGRIGGAAALAGSLLRIKPVLTLRDGRVEAWGKVRGGRKALQVALETIAETVGRGPTVRTAIMHAACEDKAREFAEDTVAAIGCPAPDIYEFSPVIGVHVGPGTLGVAAYDTAWL